MKKIIEYRKNLQRISAFLLSIFFSYIINFYLMFGDYEEIRLYGHINFIISGLLFYFYISWLLKNIFSNREKIFKEKFGKNFKHIYKMTLIVIFVSSLIFGLFTILLYAKNCPLYKYSYDVEVDERFLLINESYDKGPFQSINIGLLLSIFAIGIFLPLILIFVYYKKTNIKVDIKEFLKYSFKTIIVLLVKCLIILIPLLFISFFIAGLIELGGLFESFT